MVGTWVVLLSRRTPTIVLEGRRGVTSATIVGGWSRRGRGQVDVVGGGVRGRLRRGRRQVVLMHG